MLCDNDNLVKPDRHILNFLYRATGQLFSVNDVRIVFKNLLNRLRISYTDLTIRKLDHAIWKYMSKEVGERDEH